MTRTTGGEPPWKRMTIRVSRDGGRTFGDEIEVTPDDWLPSPQAEVWPPCECPKHRAARSAGLELPQTSRLRFDGS